MDLVPPRIDEYVHRHTTPADDHLDAIATHTLQALESPQMLSGLTVGRLLGTLVFTTGARRVLEVGTYSGYATLSMAEALAPGGEVVTCELDPDTARVAQANFDDHPHGDRVRLVVGPALETITALEGPVDLAFIDADKASYGAYLDAILPLLSPRGLIAVDNTLWSGRVLDPDATDATDDTRAIAAFNERVASDPELVSVLLTVRDGITLIRRRRNG
jgi:caffeoyl-CoA O-methyltransferase